MGGKHLKRFQIENAVFQISPGRSLTNEIPWVKMTRTKQTLKLQCRDAPWNSWELDTNLGVAQALYHGPLKQMTSKGV